MEARGASKLFRTGTHRICAPSETVAHARTLFGPLGITRVANVTGLDVIGIPVVVVCRPNARSLAVSQGKGVDLDAAKASGVMESIELYHAERVTCPLKLAAWNDLRFSHDAVQIERLPLLSASAFHPDRPLLWVEGMDLLGSCPRWVPFELVHTNYTLPFPSGSGCFVMSSNGLASGNHPLEAVSHGLCEVIERDASALFHFRTAEDQAAARLDLTTVADPDCRSVLARYARAGVAVGVWDITSDIGVSAFRCVIVDETPNPFRPLGPVEGMGCHPAREVALLRALTEAAQARLTLIAGSRDDNGRDRYCHAQGTELIDRARARLRECGARDFADIPTHAGETFEDDLAWVLARLSTAGMKEAVVVDLTKPELGIPVVRVVVPGLETYHHVQGYVPGARVRSILDRRAEDGAQP
jgi:ribosomal protein S12 methylthiotransferase accessory factor